MKITETPQIVEYNGQKYEVYHKKENDCITVILNNKKIQPEIISKIKYKNLGTDFESNYLDWYNALFFSCAYAEAPDYEKMNTSVQNSQKLAATLYNFEGDKYQKLIQTLPNDCSVFSYSQNSNITYICKNGKLSDYFCFDDIKNRYTDLGVYNVDWNRVEMLFDKPLSYFSDEEKSNINLQSCGSRDIIIVGLLLGYPIESTASSLLGDTQNYSPYNEYSDFEIKEHFDNSDSPFSYCGETWIKWNGKIIQEWRLEE